MKLVWVWKNPSQFWRKDLFYLLASENIKHCVVEIAILVELDNYDTLELLVIWGSINFFEALPMGKTGPLNNYLYF